MQSSDDGPGNLRIADGRQSHRRGSTTRSSAAVSFDQPNLWTPSSAQHATRCSPLGVMSDYISFIWAENIVAVSAIVIMGTWLRRSRRSESSRYK
jgi:hypothetical protein